MWHNVVEVVGAWCEMENIEDNWLTGCSYICVFKECCVDGRGMVLRVSMATINGSRRTTTSAEENSG